ncbi:C6 finger domain protein, putative [Paecilomyces variotii No. 5]|uniref:C6 finger domain protein, putative n=1 Tax=Byssochlamys spectabilis (strain No. 5 / NBRC 109023) TaxID=1356009 RepID=V5FBE3_BYSSN|nr:C6 finger domain protein, putative [Paecilomyces variotii No. 5]
MPRPKRPGAPEPKRRSRNGCWPCKGRKVKCGEEKPSCLNCQRQGETCDYSIRLNWEGRTKKKSNGFQPYSPVSGVVSFEHQVPQQFQVFSSANYQGQPSISLDVQGSRSPAQDAVSGPHPRQFSSTTITSSDHADGVQWSPSDQETTYASSDWTGQDTTPPGGFWQGNVDPRPSETTESYPVYSQASDLNLHGANSPQLSAFGISGSFISQPTSFLRHSWNAQPDTPKSPSVGDERGPAYSSKRVRLSSYPVSSPIGYDPNKAVSLTDSPASIGDKSILHGSNPDTYSVERHQSTPLSPASLPGVSGDGNINRATKSFASFDDPVNLRRVSVHSLLSRSAEPNLQTDFVLTNPGSESNLDSRISDAVDHYGYDYGYPDRDLNKNDDNAALEDAEPAEQRETNQEVEEPQATLTGEDDVSVKGEYYKRPVSVTIPRYLSPLPSTLLENPINLMYFHHFMNHTARILVPHHCSENPFVSVLPPMAVTDPNLLNLLLAYSASHRARYLQHPEPANRIAHWVSDVFPTLRQALNDPQENVTDSHLATAIMLLSLKIVSPSTFEVPIPWQSHLKLARDLSIAREEHRLAHLGDKIAIFLSRWLTYLDIFGALSCRHSDPPLFGSEYLSSVIAGTGSGEEKKFQIDCFMGFTPVTQSFLSRLSSLTHCCDNERFDEAGRYLTDWHPSPDIELAAETLLQDMQEYRNHEPHGAHDDGTNNAEAISIDRAFYWSVMVHLHRRVLNASPSSSEFQSCLDELLGVLRKIPVGSSPEMSVIFPIFTAGCETQDPLERLEILDRIKGMEIAGLKQVQHARTLMQRCWAEDLPWIALADGEFLG